MNYSILQVPPVGEKITIRGEKLQVPDQPILPFVEGDGTGRDIWRASVRVFDAAVEKAYAVKRKIQWMEVYAGEKSYERFGSWLPDETVEAFREFLVGIKGPLTTPIGGGIRTLNVALRKLLDLYVCQRPVRYFSNGLLAPEVHATGAAQFVAAGEILDEGVAHRLEAGAYVSADIDALRGFHGRGSSWRIDPDPIEAMRRQ